MSKKNYDDLVIDGVVEHPEEVKPIRILSRYSPVETKDPHFDFLVTLSDMRYLEYVRKVQDKREELARLKRRNRKG
jgi:hypothetical protein